VFTIFLIYCIVSFFHCFIMYKARNHPQALEHSARGHYICAVFTSVPTKTEDSFVSATSSGHYTIRRCNHQTS